MDNRVKNQRLTIRDSQNLWCTGKDSNLRTSLGGTDLQSVGFNHSPTCAKFSGDAAVALHPADHQTQHKSQFTFATQGKPRLAREDREEL